MEINKANFAEAIKSDEFKNELMPLIKDIEPVQTLINNKAEIIYKEKIDDEVKNIHTQYDDDMFNILGERPTSKDGSKQKTYDKAKELFGELKDLRGQKDSLNKDAKVVELTNQIEKLKTEGGAKQINDIFEQAKLDWQSKEADYKTKLESAQSDTTNFKKLSSIQNAVSQLKFNPDTPESVRKLVIQNAEKELVDKSKFENDKLIFTGPDGKPLLNDKYEPRSPIEMLASLEAIKDITLKKDNPGGGGADPTFKGSIKTTSVEGKDTKELVLTEGSFKTKSEFQDVANKALMDAGISKNHPDYTTLIDKAYIENKVADLPIQ